MVSGYLHDASCEIYIADRLLSVESYELSPYEIPMLLVKHLDSDEEHCFFS